MASTTSSTSTNPYSSGGMSGLVSGLDTESMVQAMLQATQNKIDKQNQLITQTGWKQDIYRDVIKQLQTFQSTFFDYLNPTKNIMSSTFFNSASVSSSNSAVSVVNKGVSANSSLKINAIKQLATAAKKTGMDNISGEVNLAIDASKLPTGDDAKTTVVVNLDGIEKTIELKGSTNEELAENFNKSLKNAYGNGVSATYNNSTGKMEVRTTSSDRTVTIKGSTAEARAALGMSSASVSNKVTLTSTLGNLNLNTQIVGNDFTFKINDVEFSFSANSTLSEVISKVNSSEAGVKMSFDSINDRFTLEASQTGAGMPLEVEDISGNLMSAIFGAKGASLVTSKNITQTKYDTSLSGTKDLGGVLSEGDLEIKVNGSTITVSFSDTADQSESDTSIETLNKHIKLQLDSLGINGTIEMKFNADGSLGFDISDNISVSFGEAEAGSIQEKLGIADNLSNATEITSSTPISLFGIEGTHGLNINGKTVTIDGTMSVDDVKSLLGAEGVTLELFTTTSSDGKTTTNKLSMYASNEITISDAAGGSFLSSIYGSDSITLNKSANMGASVDGQNAIVEVNGVEIERNTNSFDVDGFYLTLNETYNTDGTQSAIEIGAKRDTTAITDTLKEFVESYNTLIGNIKGLTSEATDYKKYPPLTDAQKKEMSENEIEKWEEKAKVGLLRNDSLLNSLLNDFRSILYTKASDDGIALYELGITTTKDGKLELDESVLESMVESNIDKISELFTDKTGGLAVKMNKIVDDYAKSSVANPGRIVSKAGIKNSSSETSNIMYDQLKNMQETLKRLKAKYDTEKKRYWAKFNALESMISNSNSTSSWLSSAFE